MKDKNKKRLKKIGAQVEKTRKEKGLSIRQLGAECDVDFAKISEIERGIANYNVTTLIELAEGLGVHPKTLLDVDFT